MAWRGGSPSPGQSRRDFREADGEDASVPDRRAAASGMTRRRPFFIPLSTGAL